MSRLFWLCDSVFTSFYLVWLCIGFSVRCLQLCFRFIFKFHFCLIPPSVFITHHHTHPISIWSSFELDPQESEEVQLSQAIKWLSIYLDVCEENTLKVEYDCKCALGIQFRVVGNASLQASTCVADTTGTSFYGTGEVSGPLERERMLLLWGEFSGARGSAEGNERNHGINGSALESNNGEGFLGWSYGIYERGWAQLWSGCWTHAGSEG